MSRSQTQYLAKAAERVSADGTQLDGNIAAVRKAIERARRCGRAAPLIAAASRRRQSRMVV